ncbi:MAG: hypothetical protein IJZ95_06395 [Oscillospiraceae bacterium]|nr:hypothetical protein [Oscillospiraceae bacterium]
MKGIFYSYFTLNKSYWITTASFFAGVTALTMLFASLSKELEAQGDYTLFGLIATMAMLVPFIPAIILLEPSARDLEKAMATRYANHILAAGVSKPQFVMCELIKNIGACAIGYGLGCLTILITELVAPHSTSPQLYGFHLIIILLAGAVEWICIPLTLKIKSSEKAGLIVGIALGVGICIASGCVSIMTDGEFWGETTDVLNTIVSPTGLLIAAGGAAAIYAVVYLITLKMVKRGDLC